MDKDSQKLASEVVKLALKNRNKFTIAESCTGGNVSSVVTDVPGSSRVIDGSFISYSNRFKELILGISNELIKEKGAVSEEVAREMASSARSLVGCDIGVSITGFAGPKDGNYPVGTAIIGYSYKDITSSEIHQFSGSRIELKKYFTDLVLNKLIYLLENEL